MASIPDYRVSTDSVANMQGSDLFWALIENAWPDVNEPDFIKRLEHVTPGQRALMSITLFIREVDNGGLEQFYWNSSGDVGDEVISGFERLGSPERAALVRNALNYFGSAGVTPKQSVRREYLSRKSRAEKVAFFGPLNSQLYGETKLYPLFRSYINAHPDEFFFWILTRQIAARLCGRPRVAFVFSFSSAALKRVVLAGAERHSLLDQGQMDDPVIQTAFDGITRDGQEIVICVVIGDPYTIPAKGHDPARGFFVEVEPLMDRERSAGIDSWQAMCGAIDLVRTALKIFVAHGGSVYSRGTRSPIDLDSHWFAPFAGVLRKEFLRGDTAPPDDGV